MTHDKGWRTIWPGWYVKKDKDEDNNLKNVQNNESKVYKMQKTKIEILKTNRCRCEEWQKITIN